MGTQRAKVVTIGWRAVLKATGGLLALIGASSVVSCTCYGMRTAYGPAQDCRADADCKIYGAAWVCERSEPGLPFCREESDAGGP